MRLSLRARVALVFGVLIVAVAVFVVQFFPARMEAQVRAQAEQRARTMTAVMASAVAPAIEFDDASNAGQILAWLASSPEARFAVVLDDDGDRFAVWQPQYIPHALPTSEAVCDHLLITRAPVVGRAGGSGVLYVGQTLDRLTAELDEARHTIVTVTVIVLVLGLVICALLATALVRPLERLTQVARDIARGARPPRIAAIAGGREVAEMTSALGTMLERLNEANRQLVEASRHAGMAEVATGVLHNVGNILTSVNVGIDLLRERAEALPADRLRRAAELLGGALHDPARLDAGVRYVAALAEQLAEERTQLLTETATLRGHVDHIGRVVTMQNGFARTGGVQEPVALHALVDEAVALACPDAARHGIALTGDVVSQSATLDRHRILQILVNLITNARDSVLEHRRAHPETGRITVTCAIADGHLEIAVDDDGGGIAPEALPRIFNAGFTTKAKGHGYGLHSSALAAEQLGGTLRCASPGVGAGARFVLRVPIEVSHGE